MWEIFLLRRSGRMSLRPIRLLFLSVILFSFSPLSRADLVQGVNFTIPGTDYYNDVPWSLGYEFYVFESFSLRALGYYDAGADGFNEDHTVGLWTVTGELLASASVTNNSLLDQWFRWESISPINLLAGTSYVIAGFSSIDDYMWNPEDFQSDSRIYFTCARYTFNTELSIPDDCYSEYLGFFGPNFLISDELVTQPPHTVPEPSSVLLFVFGAIAFFAHQYRTWRRQALSANAPLWGATVFAGFALLSSSTVYALTVTVQPVQGADSWDGLVPLASRYQRYSHENVGATLEYDNVFDADGNYIVPVGERLRLVWERDGNQLGAFEFTYVGGPTHCWVTSNGVQHCGTFNKFYAFRKLRCELDDKPFKLIAFQTGQELLNHTFDSERFKIKSEPSRWSIPERFTPKLTSGQTNLDTQTLSFIVEDDLNCGRRLKDVEVELRSTILSGSNGHDHFGASERGTGAFTAVAGFPIERSEANTRAKGKTDASGQFKVRYSAMDFALTEKVVLSIKRPAKDDHPESKIDASFIWDILLPNNFLEPQITPHGWNNGVGCIHNPAPRYMTPSAAAMLPWAFNEYTANSGGATLNANDASLPWGGKIDIPGNARSGCHVGHRRGIAIDINRTDSQGRNIWTGTHNGKSLLEILTNAMDNNGFTIFEENDSIHYDFNPEQIEP